jgi:hypothetical protein
LVTALIGCGSDVSSVDLVQREGIYYKKFSEVPFSGKLTGKEKGLIKNGKKEGEWVNYNSEGTLNKEISGIYKDGERFGKTNHAINYETKTNYTTTNNISTDSTSRLFNIACK